MAFNRVRAVTDQVPLRNILVSTYDKSALAETVRAIAALCPDSRFYATGGTFDALREALGDRAASRVVAVSDYTGQPEMQGGLVKTLDWKIYLGLLAESGNASHEADLARAGGPGLRRGDRQPLPLRRSCGRLLLGRRGPAPAHRHRRARP